MAISAHCSRNPLKDPSGKIVHRASEPSLSNRWGVTHSTRANNNSRSDKSAEQRDARSIRRQTSHHTRPETHQNLIHSNKEQHDRSTGTADTNGATTPPGRFAQAHDQTEFEHPRYRPKSASLAQPNHPDADGSHGLHANHCRRERAWGFYRVCKANAGGGDNRDRTDDPLLAKQVLSQLSYAPNSGTHQLRTTGSSDPTHRPQTPPVPSDRIGGPGRI
jgi:hypothetical protein